MLVKFGPHWDSGHDPYPALGRGFLSCQSVVLLPNCAGLMATLQSWCHPTWHAWGMIRNPELPAKPWATLYPARTGAFFFRRRSPGLRHCVWCPLLGLFPIPSPKSGTIISNPESTYNALRLCCDGNYGRAHKQLRYINAFWGGLVFYAKASTNHCTETGRRLQSCCFSKVFRN